MIEIRKTLLFAQWLDDYAIFRRERPSKQGSNGSPPETPEMSSQLAKVSRSCENYGPGYRVYIKKRGRELIILLAGGDKTAQAKDIKAALRLARNLSE